MPERRKHLGQKLDELDAHIESGAQLDRELTEPLQSALGTVRQVLDTDSEHEHDHEGMSGVLRELAVRLEVSHPKLTDMIIGVCDALSGLG